MASALKGVSTEARVCLGRHGVRIDYPTETAIGTNELAVVDSSSSRVHLMDLQCKLLAQFSIPAVPGPPVIDDVGIAVDLTGNIYVSSTRDSQVRIYGSDGSVLGSFGRSGMGIGEFNAPAGLWIDGKNRLYVADTNNGRVQVFQLRDDFGIARNSGSRPRE